MRLIDADILIDHLLEVMEMANEFGNIERVSEIGGCIGVIKGEKTIEIPRGKCKTCKYYSPYRDQFSYENRGDGYCKSTITTSEGTAYINCHDEWYCANYEREGVEK